MTVITSEVPVHGNERLKPTSQIKIASSTWKTREKKEMHAIKSKNIKKKIFDKLKISNFYDLDIGQSLLFYKKNHKLLSQIVRTPNIQVKHGLQIFNICFVSNNSTVKSKSYCCSPQERCHTEEMCTIALSKTKKSFGWIPASTLNFLWVKYKNQTRYT